MTVLRVVSAVAAMLRPFSLAFLVPAIAAFWLEPRDLEVAGVLVPDASATFVLSFLAVNLLAIPAGLLTRATEDEDLSDREGYLAIALAWIVIPAASGLPFVLAGTHATPFDAFIDAVAALTTTAFSTLAEPSLLPDSFLLWRALLQWLGAVGIVALGLALLGKLAQGGIRQAPLDASTVQASKRLRPKMIDTARALLVLYAVVTAILVALLVVLHVADGIPFGPALFDAVLQVFGAFSTGGFVRNAFVGPLDAAHLAVLGVAMVLGATGFNVLLALRAGRLRVAMQDAEWRFFLVGVALVGALLATALWHLHGVPAGDAARDGFWTTLSAASSTGLRTVSPDAWPTFVLLALGTLVFIGGCSGSAAGGLKAFRILILLKIVQRQLRVLLHPRAVAPVRVGGMVLTDAAVTAAIAFTFTFVLTWLGGSLLLALLEPSLTPMGAASGAGAALSNAGLAFHGFAPGGSLAGLAASSKAVVLALMWLGRLEVFAALLLFYPSAWRS